MPPVPTLRVRAIKQEYNTNDETWSDFLDEQALERLDDARGQYTKKTLTGDYVLDVQNFLPDEARAATLEFSGTGVFTVDTINASYWYLVINNCTGNLTLRPQGGTGAIIRAGTAMVWTSDGSVAKVLDTPLNMIALALAAVNLNGQQMINGAAGVAATDFATLSNRLNQFLAPNAAVDFGTQRAVNAGDPVASKDLVTKSFMEAAIALLSLVNLPSVLGNANKVLSVNAAGDNVEWRGAGGSTNAGAYFAGGW